MQQTQSRLASTRRHAASEQCGAVFQRCGSGLLAARAARRGCARTVSTCWLRVAAAVAPAATAAGLGRPGEPDPPCCTSMALQASMRSSLCSGGQMITWHPVTQECLDDPASAGSAGASASRGSACSAAQGQRAAMVWECKPTFDPEGKLTAPPAFGPPWSQHPECCASAAGSRCEGLPARIRRHSGTC